VALPKVYFVHSATKDRVMSTGPAPGALPGFSTSISTPLSRRFGLRLPLVQGPMAGGPTTPALVAAVSNAGEA